MEHSFDIDLAKRYGIEEAIVLKHLFFWIQRNSVNERHYHDGRYWTYNTAKGFTEIFPYMNQKKVYYVLKKLEEAGLIKIGKYNANRYDQTRWYALTDLALSHFPILGTADFLNLGERAEKNGEPIPDVNHIPSISLVSSSIKNKPDTTDTKDTTGHKYGTYKNVLMTDAQMTALKDEFPDWEQRIEAVSAYCEAHGKTYKNYLAAIRTWARKDKKPVEDLSARYDHVY